MESSKRNVMIIPAFEPEPVLVKLAEEAKDSGFYTVVVNDGSGDAYDEIFRQVGNYAEVLTHECNLGKGAALKTGFQWIKEQYGEECIVVTMDADGQHLLEDATSVRDMVRLHKDALILGCRSKLSGKAPLRSRLGNGMTRAVYRMVTGKRVFDTQTGLRAFDGRYLQTMLAVEGNRYEYEMNTLLYFAREKLPIMETEITTIYQEGNATSHFHVLRDSCLIYKEILKFSFSSLIGFVVDYIMYVALLTGTNGIGMAAVASLTISNIAARVVSATVNFTMNRKLVFHDRGNPAVSAIRYFLLAVCILCCNTLLLNLIVNGLGTNKYVAKILVELFLFLISWSVQHYFVFSDKNEQTGNGNRV